jgi:hypothetical protein
MTVNINITVFWDVTLCGLADRYQHYKGICCLYIQFSTLKMDAASSSETLVHIYQIT